jgi:hypothetical protein
VPTYKFTAQYQKTATTTSSSQTEYSVGLKIGVEGGFPGLAKLALKDSLNWTWTSTSAQSSSSGSTESASVTVGGPAFGYTGPTDIAVYFDLIYRTFLFIPLPDATPSMLGEITAGFGGSPAAREVTVTANGTRYRTFTNSRGQYRVYGNLSGPVRIQSGAFTRDLPQVPPTRRLDLAVPR